jgi:hypothetical protein
VSYESRVTKSNLAILASLPTLRHFPFPLRILAFLAYLAVAFRLPGSSRDAAHGWRSSIADSGQDSPRDSPGS